MKRNLFLLGDINFQGVTDPGQPFSLIAPDLAGADLVFANLECCLFDPPAGHAESHGFYVPQHLGGALTRLGVHAVGTANNVTIGAEAIAASLAALDGLGIAHTGAGPSLHAARRPAIVERRGIRFGFLQRTAVFWPSDHAAGARAAGVATIRGHTAYRPQTGSQAAQTRPGVPPDVLTWADHDELDAWRSDIADLGQRADVVVASSHWGYRREILAYQREYARAAIDAGAHIVFGHGPHTPLAIETYRHRPIFYGAGGFSFQAAHRGEKLTDWTGLMVRVELQESRVERSSFAFVRRDGENRTVLSPIAEQAGELHRLVEESAALGTDLTVDEPNVVVTARPSPSPGPAL